LKFKFNLQKVLEHRKTLENLAQKVFQEALYDLNVEIEKLNRLEIELRESYFKNQEYIDKGGVQASAWQQVHEFKLGQELKILRQKAVIQQHLQVVEQKRQELLATTKEFKIIEKLKEKKQKDFFDEMNYLEQKQIDEMTIMRYKKT
jgi:flagellar FliJ protein